MFFAVPFFKNALHLKETLESVLRQSDPYFSVLVLDDSIEVEESKAAESVVRSFQDSRFQYFKNPKNLGIGANWNQAIEFSIQRGEEFLCILHADDRLLPDYVSRVVQTFRSSPEVESVFTQTRIINDTGAAVFSLADWVKEQIRPKGSLIRLQGVSGVAALIPGDFIFCPTITYRVSMIKDQRFDVAKKQVLDFDWILRSLFRGGTWLGLYDEPLFEYRRHHQNTTRLQSEDLSRFKEEIRFYLNLASELRLRGAKREAQAASRMGIVRLNLGLEALKSLLAFRFRRAFRLLGLAFFPSLL